MGHVTTTGQLHGPDVPFTGHPDMPTIGHYLMAAHGYGLCYHWLDILSAQ